MEPIINKLINGKSRTWPEGFSTEAALCLLYNGLSVYTVLTVIALSMVLTGHKRRYTAVGQ